VRRNFGNFKEIKAEIICKTTMIATGRTERKIECSGSFKESENNSEITKKTTISKADIFPISLLPIIFKHMSKKK